VYRIYFVRCMNIFNSFLAQLVKYDVHTTRKINSIHAIFLSHIIILLVVCHRSGRHSAYNTGEPHPKELFSSKRGFV